MITRYKHPVLFYVMATILPWMCWFIAGHFSYMTPATTWVTFAMSGFAFLGLVSPNIIAFLLILPDPDLRRDVVKRLFNFRGVKPKYWLMAGLFMLSSILLAQAISLLFGYSATQFKLAESFSFTSGVFPVWFLLIMAPLLEELAWHSYGTDTLRSRFNLLTTSIIFGLYWGVWHLPLSAINNYYHSNLVESGLIYSLNFLFSLIPFVLIMNWLYYKTGRNILITVIFHISAGYFNEIFQTHPMSKVIQTVLLITFSVYLVFSEKDFFLNQNPTENTDQNSTNKNSNNKRSTSMKKLSILILTLVFTSVAFSQSMTQTVRGKVYDNLTNEPLPGANIIVLRTDPMMGTASDIDGYFILDRVPVGRQNILVRMMGYESYIVNELLVTTGTEPVLDIALEPATYDLDEVIVRIKKDTPLNTMTSVSSRQFTVEETQRYAGGMDDPARLASSFAGVATPSVVSNGISVRGNNPSGLLWRIEGVEAPNPNHFADLTVVGGGFLTALSNQMMGNSDFYTGAFPAEYGNATSGVFDINLKTGNTSKREQTFQAGLMGVDYATQGPFRMGDDASYIMNYRYSTMALLAPILPDDAGILKYQDLAFKVHVPTENIGTFSLWSVSSLDGQEMVAADSTDWRSNFDRDNSQTDLYMFASGLSHKQILNSGALLNTTVSATGNGLTHKEQRLDYDLQPKPQSHIQDDTWRIAAETSLSTRFSQKHSNQTGVKYSQIGYDVEIAQSQAEGEAMLTIADDDGSAGLLQAYSQSKITPLKGLSLNLGVHAQYFLLNEKYSLEPRAGLKYELNDDQSLAIAYGAHSRIERLPVYLVEMDGETPNRELDLIKSHHYVFSYNLKLNPYMRLSVEPYYQSLTNIPVAPDGYMSTINMTNDVFLNQELVNDGTGRNVGVDITFERFLYDGFYYLGTASIFDSKYTAADGTERNTRFNKNYVFNGLIGKEWMLGKGKNNVLSANFRINYSGGNRIESIDVPASEMEKEVVYGETDGTLSFEEKFKDTPVASFSVSYRKNKPNYSSIWSLHIINAGSAEEYSHDQFNLRSGNVETKHQGIMVPNLSYKIQF